jgi:hypothetical protein
MIMKERVIIKPISITKKGEIQFFQIRIPRDAERIIGIETGLSRTGKGFSEYVRRGEIYAAAALAPVAAQVVAIKVPVPVPAPRNTGFPVRFQRDSLIGELKLQSLEKANVFFSEDVYESDRNIGFADFSATRFFEPSPWTHEFKRFEETVVVNGITTLVGGYFKDRIGEQFKTNLSYQVNVYVWYEVNEERKEKDDNRLCP